MFVSRCAHCSCPDDADTTQCIPGFFSIMDRHEIKTWGNAGDFFEFRMCFARGRHPPAMCRKLRCEVFGGENGKCNLDSTWLSTQKWNMDFSPDPAYCRESIG